MTENTVKTHENHTIRLTDEAAKHIKSHLEKHPKAIGFHLGVKDAGCSSKKYVTDYVENVSREDKLFHDKDIPIYINKADLIYIAGTEVDYVQDGINKVLKFNNPNATSACGCGESFNIEE